MSRHLAGEADSAEKEELVSLLEQSPQKQYLYDLLHSWFTDLPSVPSGPLSEDDDFEKRFGKIVIRRRPRRSLAILLSAASMIGIVFLGWNLFNQRSVAEKPVRIGPGEEVQAIAGVRTRLVLPDGTQVYLNSSSKLRYSNDFNSKLREVGLEGEAWFDVAKDSQHPFIVHTSSLDIKVLGTSFTIKSYSQDKTVEATLLKGTIEISRKDNPNGARVILKPNEKLVFNKSALPPVRNSPTPGSLDISPGSALPDIAVNSIRKDIPDSNKVETAWMYNRLVFEGDDFRELAEKMERWYNVRITIRDSSLNNCHFGGAFAGETIEDALKALQLTTAFTYKIRGNEIELDVKQ